MLICDDGGPASDFRPDVAEAVRPALTPGPELATGCPDLKWNGTSLARGETNLISTFRFQAPPQAFSGSAAYSVSTSSASAEMQVLS